MTSCYYEAGHYLGVFLLISRIDWHLLDCDCFHLAEPGDVLPVPYQISTLVFTCHTVISSRMGLSFAKTRSLIDQISFIHPWMEAPITSKICLHFKYPRDWWVKFSPIFSTSPLIMAFMALTLITCVQSLLLLRYLTLGELPNPSMLSLTKLDKENVNSIYFIKSW